MLVYTPNFLPPTIVLIGAGGTGSRLVPMLCQLIRTCLLRFNPMGLRENLNLCIIDGDTVEVKNLARQNFIARDVGQHKAVVMANRYSVAYDIPIYVSTNYAGREVVQFSGVADNGSSVPMENAVFILAVDSAQARRDCLKYIRSVSTHAFVVDAGNEDDFGQISFFNFGYVADRAETPTFLSTFLSNPNFRSMVQIPLPAIPQPVATYENLGTSAQELSCADLPQTLAINSMMATGILGVLQNLLYMKPFTYNTLRMSLKTGNYTEYNTLQWLLRQGIDRRDLSIAQESISSSINRPLSVSGIVEQYYGENRKAYKELGLILHRSGDLHPIAKTQEPETTLIVEDVEPEKAGEPKKPRRRPQAVPTIPAAAGPTF